jgi:2,4-dienoyl-CoA reductase-like NADH-dependent reductase (Old Yellow Enzyme family)
MSTLFSPLSLRSLRLSNRIVIAPMCQYSAVDGIAQPWHTVHLGQLALSGAGLLIVEATAVEPIGRITAGCLGLYDEPTEQAMAELVRTLRQVSPMPLAIQLGHAGRKASSGRPWEGGQLVPAAAGGWQPVAPSAVSQLEHEPPPVALDADGLDRLCQRFVDAVDAPTGSASTPSRCTRPMATCSTSS